jgi:hypothetical protein
MPESNMLRGSEVLWIGPFHRAILDDLLWAREQSASGAFDDQLGKYIAVVNRKILGSGFHAYNLVQQITKDNPEIEPARIALHYVDPGEW